MIAYTCPEDEEIGFFISYNMMQTLEESMEEVLQEGGIIVEESTEEGLATYLLLINGQKYQGVLMEGQYSKTLLGTGFGEEEWINGIMNITFAYPEDREQNYQTEQYSYYVVPLP